MFATRYSAPYLIQYMHSSHDPRHPPVFAAFAAAVALTAATFGILRAVARRSGNWYWVEYDSPSLGVCIHTEGCSRRRQAELRFEKSVIVDLAYGPDCL